MPEGKMPFLYITLYKVFAFYFYICPHGYYLP